MLFRSSLEGMPSLAALIQVWSQRIESLAADFAAGRAAVAPTPQACRTCRLHGLCRVPAPLEEGGLDGPATHDEPRIDA